MRPQGRKERNRKDVSLEQKVKGTEQNGTGAWDQTGGLWKLDVIFGIIINYGTHEGTNTEIFGSIEGRIWEVQI
jgi:hypothetical protein